MKTLILGLVTVFAIIGCGVQAPQAPASAGATIPVDNTPDADPVVVTAEPEPDPVDEPTVLTCERSSAGVNFHYVVTRHTLTTDVDVECSVVISGVTQSFSATFEGSHPRNPEAVCQIILNVGTNEYWVFATPANGNGPIQANYANNGHAGAEVDFTSGDCHE